MIEHGFGDRAHQADRAAAIDEADVVLGKALPERDGGFHEAGIGPGAGAAIDADGFDLYSSSLMWHCSVKSVKSGDPLPQRNSPVKARDCERIVSAGLYAAVKRSI